MIELMTRLFPAKIRYHTESVDFVAIEQVKLQWAELI